MLVLPVFPQGEPPPNTGDASELSDNVAEGMKKAEEGDVSAQFELGRRYGFGVGVSEDYKEAARWYRAAAEQGHANAQLTLGGWYNRGKGVPQDYKEAFRWYRASAVQENSSAQGSLGAMYRKGLGLPQDYIQAHMWYNLATANSDLDQERKLWAKNRDSIAKMMTSEQIAEAQRLAREWKPKTGGQ